MDFRVWFTDWIASYLSSRTQIVKVGDCQSNAINVTSSVPQGSHICPVLFLLFIDDLCDNIKNSSILLYADDCKI